MEVSEVSTAELAGMVAPYNPRTIADHDLEALRRSLRFFGTVEPIVVNRRFKRIIGGHQRVRAAEAEAIDTLPVVYVDLDEPSEKQLNLALNRISGQWDLDKLAGVLGDLEAAGADLAFTGFTDAEIEQLVAGDDVSPSNPWTHTMWWSTGRWAWASRRWWRRCARAPAATCSASTSRWRR